MNRATGCRSPSRSRSPSTASYIRASRHSGAAIRGRSGSNASSSSRDFTLGTNRARASPAEPTSSASVSSGSGVSSCSSAPVNGAYATPDVAGSATPWTEANGSPRESMRRRVSPRSRLRPMPAVPDRTRVVGLPSEAACSPIAMRSSSRSRPTNRSLQSCRCGARPSMLRPAPLRSWLVVVIGIEVPEPAPHSAAPCPPPRSELG